MIKPAFSTHQSNRWLLGALVVAATVRLYLPWQYYCISSDGGVYIRTAQDFLCGTHTRCARISLPAGLSTAHRCGVPFVGDWELAGQVLSAVLGTLLLVPLYWIFSELLKPNDHWGYPMSEQLTVTWARY